MMERCMRKRELELECTTECKRKEWWNVRDEDYYLHSNLCRLLKEGGEGEELVWLLLKPQWVMKRLVEGGMFAVESDVSRGKAALACCDMGRREETKRVMKVISQATRLSHHAVGENPQEVCFQMYGRLKAYAEDCEITRTFVEEVEEIADKAEGPWAKARRGFLTAAGGGIAESIGVDGDVKCIRKINNELRILCVEQGAKMQLVKYSRKYGSTTVTDFEGGFKQATMSNDGHLVVFIDTDDEGDDVVKMWDAASGMVSEVGRRMRWISCLCVSENFRWVAYGLRSVDKVVVWDLQGGGERRGEPREFVTGREQGVQCVAVNETGRKLACGLGDGTIRVWNVESGEAICEELNGHKSVVYCVAFSENGELIVSGSEDETIRVWSAETGECLNSVKLEGWVTNVLFGEDEKTILWSNERGAFGLWERESGGAVKTVDSEGSEVMYSGASGDGSSLGLCRSRDGHIQVWDVKGGMMATGSRGEPAHDEPIWCVAVSADGKWIATGSEDGTIRLWDGGRGSLLPDALRGHTRFVWDISFSDDGRRLVSGGGDTTVRVWDVRSAAAVGDALRGHTHAVRCVALCADGTRAVSGSYETVRVWDTQRAAAVGEPLRGHADAVTCVAMSADGTRVASVSDDGEVRVWDVAAHVATHCFPLEGCPVFVSLGSASAVVWLDRGAYLCSLEDSTDDSTCVPHPAPPPPPLGSRRLELGDSHNRLWLGTADKLCRRCELGFFSRAKTRLHFSEVRRTNKS